MPLDAIPERAVSEGSEYSTTRRSKNEEIVVQMLKLVGLNIAKVMTDISENCDDRQMLYENARLLQDMSSDLNNIVVFINSEALNKEIRFDHVYRMLEQTANNLIVVLLFRWLFQQCSFCNIEELFTEDDIEVG